MRTPDYGPESKQCTSTYAKKKRKSKIWLDNYSSRQTTSQLVDMLQSVRRRITWKASLFNSWNDRIATWKLRCRKKTGWSKSWKRTSKWVNTENLTTKYRLILMSAWGWGPCSNRRWSRMMLMQPSKVISQLLKMVSRKTKPDCRKLSTPRRRNSTKSVM